MELTLYLYLRVTKTDPLQKITSISDVQWAHHLNTLVLKTIFIYKHLKVSMHFCRMTYLLHDLLIPLLDAKGWKVSRAKCDADTILL